MNITPDAPESAPALPDRLVYHRVSIGGQIVNFLAVFIPFAGLVAAGIFLWGFGFSWIHLSVMLVMWILTSVGVTVGYHRLFTHRGFETPTFMKVILAILGAMAVEGSLFQWVAQHRRHHQHSDKPDDPHSPHLHGDGFLGMVQGAWHAHVGWIFKPDAPNLSRYAGDLAPDRVLRVISKLFPVWVLLGLVIPSALGGLLTMTWTGALLGLIWGGLVRIFFVHHMTWSINSVCHLWGTRPFESRDESRNNPIFGIIGLGEGWHNNHHAFPTSARHGLRWWEIDVSYWLIRLMELTGLAWNVKLPTPVAIAAKQRRTH